MWINISNNNSDSASRQIPGGAFDKACRRHISSQVLCVTFSPSCSLLFHPQWFMWFPTHSVFFLSFLSAPALTQNSPIFQLNHSSVRLSAGVLTLEWIIDQIFSLTRPAGYTHTCPVLQVAALCNWEFTVFMLAPACDLRGCRWWSWVNVVSLVVKMEWSGRVSQRNPHAPHFEAGIREVHLLLYSSHAHDVESKVMKCRQ